MNVLSQRSLLHHGLALGALVLAMPPGALADEAPASKAPTVEVVRLDGQVLGGTFAGLLSEGPRVADAQGKVATLPGDDLVELRFRPAQAQPKPAGSRLRVTLVGGEVLVASDWGPASDGLWLASESLGRLEIPFDVMRSLVPLPLTVGVCHDPVGRSAPVAGSDVALTRSGDEVVGTLVTASADGLVMEGAGGRKRTVAWSELSVAHVDNPCLALPTGRTLQVETRGGDLLLATATPTTDAALTVTVPLLSDAARWAQVPAHLLAALRWRGVKALDLASLPFTSEHRPLLTPPPGSLTEQYLARERGARVGRRPRGCPLRLDGRTYVHGLAVHSGSTVRVALEGGFKQFQALVGIDDEAKEEGRERVEVPGDVDVRVLGDGKLLWEARGVTGLTAARRVGPLDVSGVRELVLEVGYGGHDEVLDRVTWADPLLVR